LRLFYGRGVAQTTQGTSEGDDPSDLAEVGRWGGKGQREFGRNTTVVAGGRDTGIRVGDGVTQ